MAPGILNKISKMAPGGIIEKIRKIEEENKPLSLSFMRLLSDNYNNNDKIQKKIIKYMDKKEINKYLDEITQRINSNNLNKSNKSNSNSNKNIIISQLKKYTNGIKYKLIDNETNYDEIIFYKKINEIYVKLIPKEEHITEQIIENFKEYKSKKEIPDLDIFSKEVILDRLETKYLDVLDLTSIRLIKKDIKL